MAAAELCGTHLDADELSLPLIVRNTGQMHRRKVWAAFLSGTPPVTMPRRVMYNLLTEAWTARWSTLAAVGADLAAADLADRLDSYRRPGPLDRRGVPGGWPNQQARRVFRPRRF